MSKYRRNHYVPEWFQYRFFPDQATEKKFHYLDLSPDVRVSNGHKYTRKNVLRWGPPKCFYEDDLYTTRFGNLESTEIEQRFFGKIDESGKKAVEYFSSFSHPSVNEQAFHDFLVYLSIQKIRTPKGLAYFSSLVREKSKNEILFLMQDLQQMHCALWTECIWSIVDASHSNIKFLLSDHPVTVYNPRCFPQSKWCRGNNDPDIWMNGTHTLFPINLDKLLILSNLSWVRDPYGNPQQTRPNPELFRGAIFNFTQIQTGRALLESEVDRINFIIKARAKKYVAAYEKAWLFPETRLSNTRWDKLTEPYLLMPDPRSVQFSTEIRYGFNDGTADGFDEYGHKPWHAEYGNKERELKEWGTFHAFKGEYARIFGPRRRGRTYAFNSLDNEEDSPDYHAYHLSLEAKFKKKKGKR
jgi:hypothetical protein